MVARRPYGRRCVRNRSALWGHNLASRAEESPLTWLYCGAMAGRAASDLSRIARPRCGRHKAGSACDPRRRIRGGRLPASAQVAGASPILCFSHLRWDFVWQRPQHLMSRFARDRRVYFIEEPIFEGDAGIAPDGAMLRLDRAPTGAPPASPTSGVTVVRPVCRDPGIGGGPVLDRVYARLIAGLVEADGLIDPVAWFYTPMLLPGIELLGDIRVVYDAMDELTLFRFAPDGLAGREEQLLRRAAVTFAGGASLGEAKATRHPRVRTFPSGVDTNHYRQALDPLLPLPEDLSSLPEPRVGYIGVIDERIDYELLHEVAARRPGISWVMVGPVVKVSPDELPVAPNLAYLGQKTYAELPAYVRGFATCMMPFALNDATRFISPTKTLEYMAAHRPIVSTGVTDVVRLYGDVVRVARDAGTFADQIDGALAESREARDARALLEQSHLARNSWEHIAKGMDSEMHLAFGERQRGHR